MELFLWGMAAGVAVGVVVAAAAFRLGRWRATNRLAYLAKPLCERRGWHDWEREALHRGITTLRCPHCRRTQQVAAFRPPTERTT